MNTHPLLAAWHARPLDELSADRQRLYALALHHGFPLVRLRAYLAVGADGEPDWRAFARAGSDEQVAWALAALELEDGRGD